MRKKTYPKLLFTVSVAGILLSACGGDDYKVEDCNTSSAVSGTISCGSPNNLGDDGTPPAATDYVEKSGVTGQVFGTDYWADTLVCFDNNQNGNCDDSEPQEFSYEDGKFSFDASAIEISINNKAPLLAVKITESDQTLVLYAPTPTSATAKNVNITAFTTLVMNEVTFNPFTLNSPEQARFSLQQGDFKVGNESVLLGQDYIAEGSSDINQQASDIAESLHQAQSLNSDQLYKAGAAMVDAMYQQGAYNTVITQAAIDAQTIHDQGVTTTLSNTAVEWPLGHEEEISSDLHAQGNYAVVGSQYHNRLVVLDLTGDEPVRISRNDFAASPDVARDEIDGITGASEQVLNEVYILEHDPGVLVSVEKKKKSGSEASADLGVGLYRADFSDPASIPMKRFAEDNGSRNFYPFPGLNEIAISSDTFRVALSGEDKKLTILNTSNFSVEQEFSFSSKVRSVALDAGGNTVYATLFGARTGVVILDVASGNELSFITISGTDYPQNLYVFKNQSKIAWHLRDDTVLSIYDIENSATEPVLLGQLSTTEKIKDFDISPAGDLAIIAMNRGGLELHSLGHIGNGDESETPRLIESYQVIDNTPINKVIFTADTQVLVSIRNGVQVLDIETGLPASEWDDEQKSAWLSQHRTP